MLKFLGLIFLCAFVQVSVSAQEYRQTVKGKVSDKESGSPLPGANVTILNTSPLQGSVTDEKGLFVIHDVLVGRQSIRINMTGYKEVVLANINVNSGKEVELLIELEEEITELKEIKVSANSTNRPGNPMATVSARNFSVEETQRYAATANDPARMAQSFAGVSFTDDLSNEIVVRGNSPRGLLWKLEGIEIPNPNHFSTGVGSSGGGISMLPNTVLTNSDFYTAAFPAEYGNVTSGVFDLKLRKGNAGKREYTVQLGLLGAQLAAEGPFRKGSKASYLINYRYSSLAGLSAIGIDLVDDAIPKYQDLSFNMNFPTESTGTFSVFGLGGKSHLERLAVKDSAQWRYPPDRYEDGEKYRTGIVGITHLLLLPNQKTYIKTIAVASSDYNGDFMDTLDNTYTPRMVKDRWVENNTFRFSSTLNHKKSARTSFRTGAVYSLLGYRMNGMEYNPFTHVMHNYLHDTGQSSLVQAFYQGKWKLSDNFQFTAGLHSLYFMLNNRYVIEPRAGLKWNLSNRVALNLGTGLHSRLESPAVYMIKVKKQDGTTEMPNRNLDFTRSFHNVIGLEWQVSAGLGLTAEAYYQQLFKVPIAKALDSTYSILNSTGGYVILPLVSEGKGRNYGLDITLEKSFLNSYYFLLTASVFDSKYTPIDGKEYHSYYASNYMANFLGGKEWKIGSQKQNTIGINGKIIWRGGNRYTPYDVQKSRDMGYPVYQEEKIYGKRLPDYFRIDFGASYRINKSKYNLTSSVDIQNMTNRANVAGYFYDPFVKNFIPNTLTGIIPFANVKLEF